MDLGQRGRGQRCLVKRGKNLFNRQAQFVLNTDLDRLPGHRRHLILQSSQFGHVGRRQQVRASTENLPKLDKGRPQLFQSQTNVFGRGYFVWPDLTAAKESTRQVQAASQPQLSDDCAKTVANHYFSYLTIAIEVARR